MDGWITGRFGRGPWVISALSRFGRGSIRPWVVSANFAESFLPDFI